jgi:23S rRNA pseudouridine2605 synthase
MLKLEQKQVVDLLEWAGLEVPKTPLRQLNQREKDKATAVFMPKVRKQRKGILDRSPRENTGRENIEGKVVPDRSKNNNLRDSIAKKPAPRKNVNRRVRQTSDLPAPDKQKTSMQHKSDRNRGRG